MSKLLTALEFFLNK